MALENKVVSKEGIGGDRREVERRIWLYIHFKLGVPKSKIYSYTSFSL